MLPHVCHTLTHINIFTLKKAHWFIQHPDENFGHRFQQSTTTNNLLSSKKKKTCYNVNHLHTHLHTNGYGNLKFSILPKKKQKKKQWWQWSDGKKNTNLPSLKTTLPVLGVVICLHCYQGEIKLNVLNCFCMAHVIYTCPNDTCLCLLARSPEKQKFISNAHTFKNNECFMLLNCIPTLYETSEQPTVERFILQSTQDKCYVLSFTCLF